VFKHSSEGTWNTRNEAKKKYFFENLMIFLILIGSPPTLDLLDFDQISVGSDQKSALGATGVVAT
jgi:hypothetical protein